MGLVEVGVLGDDRAMLPDGQIIDRLVGRLILRRKLPGVEGVVTRGLEQRADSRRKVRVHQALDFLMAQKARTHDSTKLT